MTPEEEWLHASLRRTRERQQLRDLFDTDYRPRVRTSPWAWVAGVQTVFLILIGIGAFWS